MWHGVGVPPPLNSETQLFSPLCKDIKQNVDLSHVHTVSNTAMQKYFLLACDLD